MQHFRERAVETREPCGLRRRPRGAAMAARRPRRAATVRAGRRRRTDPRVARPAAVSRLTSPLSERRGTGAGVAPRRRKQARYCSTLGLHHRITENTTRLSHRQTVHHSPAKPQWDVSGYRNLREEILSIREKVVTVVTRAIRPSVKFPCTSLRLIPTSLFYQMKKKKTFFISHCAKSQTQWRLVI